ncbi:MAG: hypothetical protein RIT81_18205 [Deltaproteobacteria bacterium]
MSAFAAVIVVSMGVMLSTAVTVAAFAHARRRSALYLFSGVCVAGAIYSVSTLAQLRIGTSTGWVVAAAQLGYVSACVYIALNLVFLSRYTKTALAPWERWIGLGLPGVIGVLVCIPGSSSKSTACARSRSSVRRTCPRSRRRLRSSP